MFYTNPLPCRDVRDPGTSVHLHDVPAAAATTAATTGSGTRAAASDGGFALDDDAPEEPGQRLLRHQHRRRQEGRRRAGTRRIEEVGRDGQPGRPGVVHRHRGPAGRGALDRLGERPDRHVRRDRGGPQAPRPRSSPSTPTPTPSAGTCSSTGPPPRDRCQAARADRGGDGRQGEIAILSASRQCDEPEASIEMMESELESNPGLRRSRAGRHRLRRRRGPEVVRPDRGAAAEPPGPQGHRRADHGRDRRCRALPPDSEYKGQVALTGLGTPNQMRPYVEDGTVDAFALWNPGDLGYLATYAAARAGSTVTSPARKATPQRPAGSGSSRSAPTASWVLGNPSPSTPRTSASSTSEPRASLPAAHPTRPAPPTRDNSSRRLLPAGAQRQQ